MLYLDNGKEEKKMETIVIHNLYFPGLDGLGLRAIIGFF